MTLYVSREVKSLYKAMKLSKAESDRRDAKLYANMFALSKVRTHFP